MVPASDLRRYSSKASVVFAPPLLQSDHEISREYDRYVSRQGVIGLTMAFRDQLEI